ncbi:MAG: NAD(P)/FAD-dependent oxidoreductase [Variibacter sp.]
MARSDVIVLGAGIVGTSAALQLAKRGLAVTLVDRGRPGEETSYGNTGVIGGAGVYPTAFPSSLSRLLSVALKRSPEANYHWAALPRLLPYLWAYRAASTPKRMEEIARVMHPLMSRSLAEHETLLAESNALGYLRKNGWITIYRGEHRFADLGPELDLCKELGVAASALDVDATLALEPNLAPVFKHAVFWPHIGSLSNPLAVTRAYAARFAALGGVLVNGDARSLHRQGNNWRVDTAEGPIDAPQVVVALGIWTSDVLEPFGIRLPLGIKRGYHRHFRPRGNVTITRPTLDVENGYVLTPMEQGLRLTTGAEFADRDAPPTPVQFDRLMPAAKELFPIGERADDVTWMGRRPMFADSTPVVGPAPGQRGLWLNFGHGHYGLTLGPVTGRLLADQMTGQTPFIDPTPYRAERFRPA